MNPRALSSVYAVRRLTAADVDKILVLCAENPLFYRYHPPLPTRESILADMVALPQTAREQDKYYLGYFADGALVAVLDLILHYPRPTCAYIGFFMLRRAEQGRGLGTALIAELIAALRQNGVKTLHLAIDRENPQSRAFWTKNGFAFRPCEADGCAAYLPMELTL